MSDSSSVALERLRRPLPAGSVRELESRVSAEAAKLLASRGFWMFTGAAMFCWFSLFRLPGTPIWTGGDQTMWLENGQRMFFGEVLYRDITA
jgi:hypothetical protein